MKDLVQEGRDIYTKFKTKLIETHGELDADYVNQVRREYVKMAKKIGRVGPFKFYDAKSQNIGGASNDWIAPSKNNAQVQVIFEPYSNGMSYEVEIFVEGDPMFWDTPKKFNKKIQSLSGNPIQDAKDAFDYIKQVLNSPQMKTLLTRF